MQKAIQLFEQDFARWGVHIPGADVAARSSGMLRVAGWHILYDFGRDNRGEFLDYYAALRDGTDPAVTDDWHVRLYETGDRVTLPTVLEAYMYARDPTAEELARARRKFADPQPAAATPKPPSPPLASPQPANPQPANPRPVNPLPASPLPASPRPAPPRPATPRPATPRPANPPAFAGTVSRDTHQAVVSPSATAVHEVDAPSADIALEVGLDIALAGVAPVPGGDRLASWLLTPAVGSLPIAPATPTAAEAKPAPPAKPAPVEDDSAASGLVFVPEPPPARISDRTAAITADDDTVTISMIDDELVDDAAAGEQTGDVLPVLSEEAGDASGSAIEMEGFDHFYAPSRVSSPATASLALASDDDAGSIAPAERRHSPAPAAMLTTDIAAVAGSFEPWWYRPTTRRIAMVAAAVIAIIIAGSVFTHRSPAGSGSQHARADAPAVRAHAAASPTPPASDQSDEADSSAQGADTTPDSLPVASTPSSVTPETASPAAEDGIARPAGPRSVSPIRQSGTPRAPLGAGKTADNSGPAQH
jgi:hypothetical protein